MDKKRMNLNKAIKNLGEADEKHNSSDSLDIAGLSLG